MKKILFAAWPALLITSFFLLPWLNKAHTTDDTTFLLMSEHVLKDPLHPAAFEMMADGNRIRLSSQLVSGPVTAYLLVPCVLLGGAEWAAHIMQYLLLIAALLATVSLAYRLGLGFSGARAAGLLMASTPAVLVMATTSMADVPAMAFAVLGMERFVAWRNSARWHQSVFCSLFFAFAALARPHLVLILVIAFVLELSSLLPHFRGAPQTQMEPAQPSRPRASRMLLHVLPLFFSALIIMIATTLTADPIRTGNNFMGAALSRFHPVNAASNMTAFFSHWVLVFPLALLWICLGIRWKRLWRNPALWIAGTIVLAISMLDQNDDKVPAYALGLAFIGALIMLDILVDTVRRRDGIQFFLWAWLLIALPAVAYVQLPCRYLIPSAPAVAILLASLIWRESPLPFFKWLAISAGLALAVLIVSADAEFGALGRRLAKDEIAPRVKSGAHVWINSEWGFEWYALKAGAVPVSKQRPRPLPGDLLVSSSAAPHLSLDLFPNRQLIDTIVETSHFGRVMSTPAGFYSNGYGYCPWTRTNGELDRCTVWKIK
jgi:hypothetical protein